MERSRTISEMDANAYPPAVFGQTAFDNPGQEAYIDIATTHQDRSALPVERGLLLQQSCQGHGSGSLRQGFLPFEEHHDGVGDFLFIDGDDLVDKAFYQGQGEVSCTPDRDAVRDGRFGWKRDGASVLHGAQHGGETLRLYTHDTNSGVSLLQCAGDATDQPPSADGHDDCLQALHLLQQLETNRPLTIDHRSVIERMQERHPL